MKRLFFDIDGTLLQGSHEQGLRLLETLNKKVGTSVGIATTRDYPGACEYYESISLKDVCVVENGALLLWDGQPYYLIDIRPILQTILESLTKIGLTDINFTDQFTKGRTNSMRITLPKESEQKVVIALFEKYGDNLDIKIIGNKLYAYPKGLSKLIALEFLSKDLIYIISNFEESVHTPHIRVVCIGDNKWHKRPLTTIARLDRSTLPQLLAAINADTQVSGYTTSKFGGVSYHQQWQKKSIILSNTVRQVYGYVIKDGMIAIVRTSNGWQLPGGKPEGTETIVQTLQREVREEGNITIAHPVVFGYIKVFEADTKIPFSQVRLMCEYKNTLEGMLNFETEEVRFVSPTALRYYFPWFDNTNYQQEYAAMCKILKECFLK